MARPCRQDTRAFRRILTDEQREILLAAGDGDITIGFNECLELWRSINPLKGHFMPNVSRETHQAKYPGNATRYPKNAPSDPLALVSPMKR